MERPQTGELYRHFKGNLYQIVGTALHTETGEELVIYQALYGDYRLYARPLAMFVGEVDHEKYPGVRQRRRFERVARAELETKTEQKEAARPAETRPAEDCGPELRRSGKEKLILEFLDLHGAAERIALLQAREEELTEEILDTLAAALDVQIEGASTEEKLYDLRRCLEAVARFETGRMR